MRFLIAFITTVCLSTAAYADRVDAILAADKPPTGVVIEIVEADEQALKWALPSVERISARLHAKYPGLPIAVVTHGNEQFGLVEDEKGAIAAKIRRQALNLTEAGATIHVCGGHAEMRGVPASAFPDYIKVSASGPHQITVYRNQGYELIILRQK